MSLSLTNTLLSQTCIYVDSEKKYQIWEEEEIVRGERKRW